uniref:Uncharacterized protein n=1 Tax=Lepeophtheirus salmonis TaxID=72036 RepID=A0A0K2VAA3_LEPSM
MFIRGAERGGISYYVRVCIISRSLLKPTHIVCIYFMYL